jgi:hydrogenase nickel incorporation protein HypA/HybF
MHELAVMEDVVREVETRIGTDGVRVIRLEIGQLAGVARDALEFCFEVCTSGTGLAGAKLDIVEIQARAICRTCGVEHAVAWFGAPCACGSFDQRLVAGTEMRLKEVELV